MSSGALAWALTPVTANSASLGGGVGVPTATLSDVVRQPTNSIPLRIVAIRGLAERADAYADLFDFIAAPADSSAVDSVYTDTPGQAKKHYDLAIEFLRRGQLERASEHIDQVLVVQPNHAEALNAKGVIAAKQKRYEEAYDLFEQAVGLAPERAGMRLNMAITLYLLGRRQEAAAVYGQVLELDEHYDGFLDLFDIGE